MKPFRVTPNGVDRFTVKPAKDVKKTSVSKGFLKDGLQLHVLYVLHGECLALSARPVDALDGGWASRRGAGGI